MRVKPRSRVTSPSSGWCSPPALGDREPAAPARIIGRGCGLTTCLAVTTDSSVSVVASRLR